MKVSKPAMSWTLRRELENISRDLGHQMSDAWPHGWYLTREQMEAKHPDKLAAWDAYRDARARLDATIGNATMIDVDALPSHAVEGPPAPLERRCDACGVECDHCAHRGAVQP